MPIKQVAQGIASGLRSMYHNPAATIGIAGFGTSVAALGLMAPGRAGGRFPHNPGQNTWNVEDFKDKTFMQRQSMMATVGMFGEMSHGGGAFSSSWGAVKGLGMYNWERAKDMYATSGLPGGGEGAGKAARYGMTGGAIAGAVAGLAIGGLTKMPMGRAVLGFAGIGAFAGGYQARKVSLQVMESFNQAKKSSLDRNRLSNRARTMGSGFRSWTRGNRKGRPGHLGMDGTVPFSMHKARHRSTI